MLPPASTSPGRLDRLPGPTYAAAVVLVALAYGTAARLSLEAAVINGNAGPLWPPSGIALVVLLLGGRRLWPGIFVGSAVVNVLTGVEWPAALAIGAGATLEAVLGAVLLERLRVRTTLDRLRDVGLLCLVAAVGAAISASVGVTAIASSGTIPWSAHLDTWVVWWAGDAIGVLVLTPIVLSLAAGGLRSATAPRSLLVLAATLVTSVLVLSADGGQPYLVFPLLAWASLTLGPPGAAMANLLVSGVTIVGAARGYGPFSGGTVAENLHSAQAFLLTMSASSLVLAAIASELRESRTEVADLADEQAALRRVATAVAVQETPERVMTLVCRSICELLGVEVTTVVRFTNGVGDGFGEVEVLATWGGKQKPLGAAVPIAEGSAADHVRRTGRAHRFDERGNDVLTLPPYTQRIAAPVVADGRIWGAVIMCDSREAPLPLDGEARLTRFAELAGLAIANAQARSELLSQALTDPLTGLANHRAFHARVAAEVRRATRFERSLAVAVIDLDGFKDVNDRHGHHVGDDVLRQASDLLLSGARAEDLVGRLGGDELALLLVEADADAARAAAERACAALAEAGLGPEGTVTASVGLCDLRWAQTAEDLLRLADRALYQAKAEGGNRCVGYDPERVPELDDDTRLRRREQHRTFLAVQAMARAVDAKDPRTTRHSERVAALAERLALEAGWSESRAALLRQAGLVHDVGKIGVPDAILFKPGPLDADEYDLVRRHASLGAEIADGVLLDEQVAWIRGHHERHDGHGYPDGLAGEAISDGAALLALADAWDAMTAARPYRAPLEPEVAYGECRAQAGRQFSPDAVALLDALWTAGAVELHGTGAMGGDLVADLPR